MSNANEKEKVTKELEETGATRIKDVAKRMSEQAIEKTNISEETSAIEKATQIEKVEPSKEKTIEEAIPVKEKKPKTEEQSSSRVTQKNEEQGKGKKIFLTVLASFFGVVIIVYLGISVFFMSHFYYGTKINGVNFSLKTMKQIDTYMMNEVEGYKLDFKKLNQVAGTIKGSDIGLKYTENKELAKALKKQNSFLWVQAFFVKNSIKVTVPVEFDEQKLIQLIDGQSFMDSEGKVPSENAVPEFNGSEFVVKPEVLGTIIDRDEVIKKTKEHVSGFVGVIDMEKEGCYILPEFTKDSTEVVKAKDDMNRYLGGVVTYDMTPNTEVVSKEIIASWMTVDEKMQATIIPERVQLYVEDLAAKYNTVGKARPVTAPNGKAVEITGGDYGWLINNDDEFQTLLANVQSGEPVTREPAYKRRAVSHDGYDFGQTYAEVDLTTQYMWFVKNGVVVMETPIVTGKPSKGYATPQGTYSVTYTQSPAVLRAPLRPDGTREYETPVTYWMPFNGGIGFHDASWQNGIFGGNRYLSNGSHGCVNMPPDKAKILFNELSTGMPVICHY